MFSVHLSSAARRVLALIAVLALTAVSEAQQPVPPRYPTLAMPFPMGVQRGTAIDLTLTGGNLAAPTAVWTDIPGAKVAIPTDNNNGKDNGKLRVRLEVPREVPIGCYALRLATTHGPSNLRLFCVDDLPQVVADGKNRARATAPMLPVPCVVAGTVAAENSDWYKIAVTAGQRLSFDLLASRLGSPLDPQLSLTDPRSGRKLAASNDALGLQKDARLTHTFKEAGEYLIEIRDEVYRGGGDYVYRLRIGDFPCATTPIPMGAKRGSKVPVNFAGTMVENVPAVEVQVPADPNADTVGVAPKSANGLLGWPVSLAVSDLDEVVEQEPNNEPAKANRIPVPGAVSGRFLDKGDIDYYQLPLKKGRYVIEAHTFALHSPTEVYMTLKNAKGAAVLKTDPQNSPRLDFTAPADGEYLLVVESLLNTFGPAETYRVTVKPYEPGFEVKLTLDRTAMPPGGVGILSVGLPVRRDYTGPIELSVVGAPGISGQLTLAPDLPKPPQNQPAALLFVRADAGAAPGLAPIKVQCVGTINGKTVTTYASVRAPVRLALSGLPFPPRRLLTEAFVAVTEKPPFTLAARFDQPEALRGVAAGLTITAVRAPGFEDEIALTPIGLPANVAPKLKNIPKGVNEVKVEITAATEVPLGHYLISCNGKSKFQNKEVNVTATPAALVLVLPFDLKIEPEKLAIDINGKAKFKVTALRKGGYQGPIALQLRNLPANVTAPAATIEMGKNDVEIELTAPANAAVGDKADVHVLGTAPAAANQQNASPNFTVSIIKK